MTLKQEVWYQDPADEDRWAGEDGVLINTAALEERSYYFEIIRLPAQPEPTLGPERIGGHAS